VCRRVECIVGSIHGRSFGACLEPSVVHVGVFTHVEIHPAEWQKVVSGRRRESGSSQGECHQTILIIISKVKMMLVKRSMKSKIFITYHQGSRLGARRGRIQRDLVQ
jgi:hypothetical protein